MASELREVASSRNNRLPGHWFRPTRWIEGFGESSVRFALAKEGVGQNVTAKDCDDALGPRVRKSLVEVEYILGANPRKNG